MFQPVAVHCWNTSKEKNFRVSLLLEENSRKLFYIYVAASGYLEAVFYFPAGLYISVFVRYSKQFVMYACLFELYSLHLIRIKNIRL